METIQQGQQGRSPWGSMLLRALCCSLPFAVFEQRERATCVRRDQQQAIQIIFLRIYLQVRYSKSTKSTACLRSVLRHGRMTDDQIFCIHV